MDSFEIFMNIQLLVNMIECQYFSQSFHYYTYKPIILKNTITIKSQILSTTHFNPNSNLRVLFFPYQTTSSLLIIILHIQETPLSPSISQFKNKTLQIIYKQSQKGTTHTKLLGINLVAKKRKVK